MDAVRDRTDAELAAVTGDPVADPSQVMRLEDFRDEASALPHAAQLQQGFRWLRFMPALEREFYTYYWNSHLARTRLALIAAAIVGIPFALRDYFSLPQELAHLTVGLRLLGIMPLLAIGSLLLGSPHLERYREAIIAVGVVFVLGTLGGIIVIADLAGQPLPYEGLMLVIVFVFFISGLRTIKAGISTLLAVVGMLLASHIVGLSQDLILQEGSFLIGLILICTIGGYLLEMAIRRNFLTEKLAEFRAGRDSLTLLHNRRSALQHLAQVWRIGTRERAPVALMLIDVDHFKRYNDVHGHLAGDGCLSEVAFTLASCLSRPMDMVARYGGEEFIAIAYGAGEEGVSTICERMRQAVQELEIAHESASADGLLTVSIGAAWALPAIDDITPSLLLDEADRALYRAKELGRNRWEVNRSHSVLAAAAAA